MSVIPVDTTLPDGWSTNNNSTTAPTFYFTDSVSEKIYSIENDSSGLNVGYWLVKWDVVGFVKYNFYVEYQVLDNGVVKSDYYSPYDIFIWGELYQDDTPIDSGGNSSIPVGALLQPQFLGLSSDGWAKIGLYWSLPSNCNNVRFRMMLDTTPNRRVNFRNPDMNEETNEPTTIYPNISGCKNNSTLAGNTLKLRRESWGTCIQQASSAGSYICVITEACVGPLKNTETLADWAVECPSKGQDGTIYGSETSQYFAQQAIDNSIWVCVGLAEIDNGNYYDSVLLFDDSGICQIKYRKRILTQYEIMVGYSKDPNITPQLYATHPVIGKVACAICVELQSGLMCEQYYKDGVRAILAPTNASSSLWCEYIVANTFCYLITSVQTDGNGCYTGIWSPSSQRAGDDPLVAKTTTNQSVATSHIPTFQNSDYYYYDLFTYMSYLPNNLTNIAGYVPNT